MALVSPERLREIAEPFGGVAAFNERFEEHSRAAARLNQEWSELLKIYPDRWVAMGQDGVLAVADTNAALLADVRGLGFESGQFVVEFFDTYPEVLIL